VGEQTHSDYKSLIFADHLFPLFCGNNKSDMFNPNAFVNESFPGFVTLSHRRSEHPEIVGVMQKEISEP